jgi:nucleoside-diphosphate-sugar epimerase
VRVLILGGTVFLSRAVAQEYVARGHDVTGLSRRPDSRIPEGVSGVSGDRSRGLHAYDDVLGDWDEVVDVATDPHWVRDALSALGERARHWTYVSSCSVYVDQNQPDGDELDVVFTPLGDGETPGPENYGASKVACEVRCREALGERLLVVRPGLIVGAGDTSDRGGYWPARLSRDHEPVLVPEASDRWAQMIDVCDLAQWMVRCGEEKTTGTFNAVGERRLLSELLEELRVILHHHDDVVLVDDQWLLEQNVSPWAGPESLPLWIPAGRNFDGFARRSNAKARRQGLALRPLEETVADIVAYEFSLGLDRDREAGLSAPRERQLIEEFASVR